MGCAGPCQVSHNFFPSQSVARACRPKRMADAYAMHNAKDNEGEKKPSPETLFTQVIPWHETSLPVPLRIHGAATFWQLPVLPSTSGLVRGRRPFPRGYPIPPVTLSLLDWPVGMQVGSCKYSDWDHGLHMCRLVNVIMHMYILHPTTLLLCSIGASS